MPNKTGELLNQTGVMLINTGTPSAPTKAAVQQYLARFLSDRHIVNLPPLLWQPILHGIVLRTRPRKTVRIYQSIWTDQGSPYSIHSRLIERLLREAFATEFASATTPPIISMAHRYGEPSIMATLTQFQKLGVNKLVILPLYPQQAIATTNSVDAEIRRVQETLNYRPALSFIENYHDHPLYIDALATQLAGYLENTVIPPHKIRDFAGTPEASEAKQSSLESPNPHIIFSYHSVPLKDLRNGDKYCKQVTATTELLASRLQLANDSYSTVFQSRFEDAQRWQGPFLPDRLRELLDAGVRNFVIIAPVFAVDCTETLYEIDIKERNELYNYAQKQGIDPKQLQFTYVPALNSNNAQIELLKALITSI